MKQNKMEPEEIDKLFKTKFNGLPATPSADAWARLQAKMEPPQKERTMWIYYAAASVIILLVSGLLLFRNYNQEPAATVAQNEIKKPAEINNLKNPGVQATSDTPVASTEETVAIEEKIPANTAEKAPALFNQKPAKADTKAKLAITKTEVKPKVKPLVKQAAPTESSTPEDKVLVAQNTIKEPKIDKAINPVNMPGSPGVVQVFVKQDASAEKETENPEEMSLRENISRKGILLKNIYKQARNLKNGEPVELATLGLNTEKINAEKENIKQKINKVISL